MRTGQWSKDCTMPRETGLEGTSETWREQGIIIPMAIPSISKIAQNHSTTHTP